MIRRLGEPRKTDRTYNMRPGAYAILPRKGHVLLTAQMTEDGPDLQLPGGGIDPGESPLRALHREVFEETGWSIANPRRIGAFRRFCFMPEYDLWAEKLCHIYVARPTKRIGSPTEADHYPLWSLPTKAVLEIGNAGDAHMLTQFYRGHLTRYGNQPAY